MLLDPSVKSFKNVERITQIAKNIDINWSHLYLVANYRFPEEEEKHITDLEGDYLGRIEYDLKVEEYNLKGKSLLELPEDSQAYQSIKKILIKAGYK